MNTSPFVPELLRVDLSKAPHFEIMSRDLKAGIAHIELLWELVHWTMGINQENYNRFFRDIPIEGPYLFEGDLIRIQWDGYYSEHDNSEHWRLVWRDFVIGWHKQPHHCLTVNRYLSEEERAQFLIECKLELESAATTAVPVLAKRTDRFASLAEEIRNRPIKIRNSSVFGSFGSHAKYRDPNAVFPPELLEKVQYVDPAQEKVPPISDAMIAANISMTLSEAGEEFKKGVEAITGGKRNPYRVSRMHYGDLFTAALNDPDVKRIFDERLTNPGFEIVDDMSPEEAAITDLSIMFMYPHVIKPIEKPIDETDQKPEGDKDER